MNPQTRGGVEHRGKLLTPEPGTDRFGCGDDQAEDLLLGLGGGVDRGAAGSQEHRKPRCCDCHRDRSTLNQARLRMFVDLATAE